MNEITSALIAGGSSSRFGTSKMEAMFRGKRLIDYALQLAGKVSDDIIIIAGSYPLPEDVSAKVYHDIIPNCGPLGGIYTALYYAATPRLAILPVDMPLLPLKIYNVLLAVNERERPVVAVSHAGLESLVSLWPKSTLPIVEHSLGKKELGIYKLLKKLNAIRIDLPSEIKNYEEKWFLNINSMNDLDNFG